MTDLLVRLYDLERFGLPTNIEGYLVRRAASMEQFTVLDWIGDTFSDNWRAEAARSFCRDPISCFLALRAGEMCGFAAYDVTARGFFGPTGVHPDHRGRGLGKALLARSLAGLRDAGYAYGIIGWAGPISYYQKTVDALVIPKSSPGAYPADIWQRQGGV